MRRRRRGLGFELLRWFRGWFLRRFFAWWEWWHVGWSHWRHDERWTPLGRRIVQHVQ
jgi:hypothetical protein